MCYSIRKRQTLGTTGSGNGRLNWPCRRSCSRLTGWSLAFVSLMACHSQGFLELRGTVVSATNNSPIADAELHLRFNVSDSAWALTCEEARASAHPSELFRSDNDGKFDIGNWVYGGGGPGCSSCKRGVLCVSKPGFQTQRFRFDDCDDAAVSSGEDKLVVLLDAE